MLTLAAAGCGGHSGATSAAEQRQWVANAGGVIDQFRRDVEQSTVAGDTIASSRAALHDQSDLFALLLAYTDFGGCAKMVDNLGLPAHPFAAAATSLSEACGPLERAASLFTRSTSRSDARSLLAASHEALAATPLLNRARFELAAAAR